MATLIGSGPNQVPLNQFLGSLAYRNHETFTASNSDTLEGFTWASPGALGSTSPNDAFIAGLTVTAGATISSAAGTALQVTNTGTGNSFVVYDQASDTTPFLIDAAGKVVIGSSASWNGSGGWSRGLQNYANGGSIYSGAYSADAVGGQWGFSKSRSATVGTHSSVANNDQLGAIVFDGSDGTNFITGAHIMAEVDGAVSTNVVPGRLLFFTAGTERMRLNSTGQFLLGTTGSTVGGKMEIRDDTANAALGLVTVSATIRPTQIFTRYKAGITTVASADVLGVIEFRGYDGSANTPGASIIAAVDGTPTSGGADMPGRLVFSTTAEASGITTERMRIDSYGGVGIGGTAILGETLRIARNISGASLSVGIHQIGTVQSGVTQAFGIRNVLNTAAFALTDYYHYHAAQGTIGTSVSLQVGYGAGSGNIGAATNYGFLAADTALTGAGKSSFGFYSIVNTATGGGTTWSFYSAGTAPNVFIGQVGVGAAAPAGYKFSIRGTHPASGGSAIVNSVTGTFDPTTTTTAAYGYYTAPTVSAGTLPQLYHYVASAQAYTGTVTTQYGFVAAASLVGAGANYGFYSSLPLSTGDYNFYASGDADNFFAGRVGIGNTPSYNLDVVDDINGYSYARLHNANLGASARSSLIISVGAKTVQSTLDYTGSYFLEGGTGVTSRYFDYDVFNFRTTAGTQNIRIDSAGRLGINTTVPRSKLHVDNAASEFAIIRSTTGLGGTAFTGTDTIPIASGQGFLGYSGLAVIPTRWGNATTADYHTGIYLAGGQRTGTGATVASIAFANWGYFSNTTSTAGGLANTAAQADAVAFTISHVDGAGQFTQRLVFSAKGSTGAGTGTQRGQLLSNGDWEFGGVNGGQGLKVTPTASSVNYLQVEGGASGTPVTLTAQGTNANLGILIDGEANNIGIAQLTVKNTGTNGSNIKITGNGATTPSKYIRVIAGRLEVINDAYTTAVLTVTDAGQVTVNTQTGGIGYGVGAGGSATQAATAATALVNGTVYTVCFIGTTDFTLIGGTNVIGATFTKSGPAGLGTGTAAAAGGKGVAVTLNKPTGSILMNANALAADAVIFFQFNNSQFAINDTLVVNASYSGGNYTAFPVSNAAGSVFIGIRNNSGSSLSEPVLLNFAIIKGSVT